MKNVDEQQLSENIAKNLNNLIYASGMTQRDFAKKMGIAPSTVNEWIKGGKTPRITKIDKICETFGITRDDLLADPNVKKPGQRPTYLDPDEFDLIEKYRKLSDQSKRIVKAQINLQLSI